MLKKTGQLLKKYYPLTLPNVKPETKYRANEINNITTGILTKIDAAAYSPHCVDKLDWNDFNLSCFGDRSFGWFDKVSGTS